MGDVGFPPLWTVQLLIRGVKMAINNGRNDLFVESRGLSTRGWIEDMCYPAMSDRTRLHCLEVSRA
jgi:hypothetical protein